jgi:Spy/CpxP family protein refolding chaperone
MLPQNSPFRAPLGRARFSTLHSVSLAAAIFAASTAAFAQDNRGDSRRRGGDTNGGDRGNFNPQEMQARMLSGLRERMGVTNDDEWTVISDRLTKVMELRRASGGGLGGFMFGGRGGDTSRGGDRSSSSRSRSGSNTDVAALTAAVTDKLPDAEIKARLDRVREQRKENEAKLAKAQEELRAVLSVRQEAMLVLGGLLP